MPSGTQAMYWKGLLENTAGEKEVKEGGGFQDWEKGRELVPSTRTPRSDMGKVHKKLVEG